MARRKREAATDEVSNDEVEPRVKPRPRKKQAVTKTHSTTIKALIRKNAATSPLLQLPSEVRENILIHLLGDKLIHIKYVDAFTRYVAVKNEFIDKDGMLDQLPEYVISDSDNGDPDNGDHDSDDSDVIITFSTSRPTPSYREVSTPASFRHAICVANQSEQSAYQEASSGYTVIPEGELPDLYVASCEERHANCNMCGNGPMSLREQDLQALRVDLNVLGVCRQLYEEANHLLWATNTFSFEDPKAFKQFFGSLNPAQKRKLTSIHISANIGTFGSYSTTQHRARRDRNYWGTALNMSNLKMLRGVQTLHLCLNQVFECVRQGSANDTEQQIKNSQETDMKPILLLRALSVKHVTVIVSDIAEELIDGRRNYRWTAAKKNEYAETIRVQLVDPSGAQLVKMEAEIASLARKTGISENAAANVETYKSVLKDRKAQVIRSARWASSEESNAVLAVQKADQVSRKSSKKAARLQRDAVRQKEKAAVARESAELAVEREKVAQDHLAKARDKYRRAMARLGVTPQDIEDMEAAEMLMEGFNTSEMDLGEDQTLNPESEDNESMSQSEEESSDESSNESFNESSNEPSDEDDKDSF